jgi:hypothetical protein
MRRRSNLPRGLVILHEDRDILVVDGFREYNTKFFLTASQVI